MPKELLCIYIVFIIEVKLTKIRYMQSTKQKGNEGDRLFLLAMDRFEAALSSTPDNSLMLENWGDALYQQV